MTMTGRERLLATLRRQQPDRIAIAPFLYYNNVYEMFGYRPRLEDFTDPQDFDVVARFVEYCDAFGFDVLHTLGSAWTAWTPGASWENWDVTVTEEGSDNERQRVTRVRTPGGALQQTENIKRSSTYLVVSAIDEYLIKTPADFDLFARYAPPAEQLDCRLVTRARAAAGEKGLVDSCTQGVFNALGMLRKLDDVMMDPYVDEGFYHTMMEFLLARTLQQDRVIIAAGADIIEMGANMATGAVGPRFFTDYVLDYEKRLAAGIHEAGAYTIYHNCGDAAKIMHLYNELEIDVWGYLTPRPFGDVDLDQALAVMRPDMVLRGNIDQVEFLVQAGPAEIKARVAEVLGKVKARGNFILSTTDFLFDGTPYENIRAFAEAGREYGRNS